MSNWAISTAGSGGSFTDFDTLGFSVASALGAGMPDLDLQEQAYAQLDGSQHQRTRALPRILTLRGWIQGTSASDLHSKRSALIANLRRDNNDPQTPVTLRYTGGPVSPIYIDALYQQGLPGGEHQGIWEEINLRFKCNNPFWYGAAASTSLNSSTNPATVSGNVLRRVDGTWSAVPSVAAVATALTIDALGRLLIGTATAIYRYDGTALSTLGTTNGAVYCFQPLPDGGFYTGGAFTTINGSSYKRVAKYSSGGAWSSLRTNTGVAGGGPDNGAVYALCLNNLGDYLYIGGSFTTIHSGLASPYSAFATTNADWTFQSGAFNGTVYTIAIDASGVLYYGGDFTLYASTACSKIIALGGAGTFNGGATGASATVRSIVIGPDNAVYIGGTFSAFGGIAAANVARVTNGTLYESLGFTFGSVSQLIFDANGLLHAAGAALAHPIWYTTMGWGVYNGSVWTPCETTTTNVVLAASGSTLYAAPNGGSLSVNQPVSVTNAGATAVAPVITIANGGYVYEIINWRTGSRIYLDSITSTGDTLTIDCAKRTIATAFRGRAAMNMLLSGSQLSRFTILPGANPISIIMPIGGGSATSTISYTNQYWSNDG